MDERNGLLIVSGCPRSGTSVCMDIQRVAHGDDKILGHKFPQENRKKQREEMLARLEGENPHMWQIRKYLFEKQEAEQNSKMDEDERDFRDMNPEGFWEMAFTVQGVIYRPQFKELLEGVLEGDQKICKVVSQGLMDSDPMYLGKIIYMMRHPRQVAKSQERLVRGFNFKDPETGKIKNALEDFKIHSPEMYIGVTVQASQFFLNNPDIPVRFFDFDDLIENPEDTIDEMGKFVGYGDYTKAYDVVQKKLKRSFPEDIPNPLWEDAEFVYDKFYNAANIINGNGIREEAESLFRDIIEYFQDPYNRDKMNWRCFRAKQQVNETMCRGCISSPAMRANMKSRSESIEGQFTKHWSEEPCLFECGFDLDRDKSEYITIEESIKNNFWRNDDDVDR
jgi:hypothetical protein